MTAVVVISAVSFAFIVIGFHIAFRQKAIRRWLASARGIPLGLNSEPHDGDGEFAPALRIAGVMIMVFSFTAGAFANLIAYYTANSPN